MTSNKKNPAAAVSAQTSPPAAPAAAPVKAAASRARSVRSPAANSAAKPTAAKAAAVKTAAVKTAAAKKPAAAKPAKKALDPAVQASKEALAKALAAAQAVKITKPLGKPAKAGKVEKPVARADKAPKAKKPKLVRDSFTMPEAEYAQIAALKKRLVEKGMVSKKSELLRAGVALLVALSDGELVAAMQKVEVIKTGRPAKSGK